MKSVNPEGNEADSRVAELAVFDASRQDAQCVRDSAKPDWREELYVKRTVSSRDAVSREVIPPGIPRRDEVVVRNNDPPA